MRSRSSRATRTNAVLRSSEPWISTTRGAPGGPGCSATKRSATAAHARTLDPWSCCSSATRCRCASTRASSTVPPIRRSADLGHAQAAALAEWLADEEIDAIWCSPMRRARETAAPARRAARASTSPSRTGIAEYDRDGASYIPVEELKAANDPRWYQVPEQPEHFRAVVVEAVERIVAAHPRQRVAVVCHGGVINVYAGHVLGIDDPLFFLPAYTSISRVLAASSGERSIASAERGRPPPRPLTRRTGQDADEGSVPPNRALELRPWSTFRIAAPATRGRPCRRARRPGRPSTRSPRMFLAISVVPPSIELARVRRNACCGLPHVIACSGRFIG